MEKPENKIVELTAEEMGAAAGGYRRPPEKEGFIIYQIKKGDNLSKLANKFNTTVEDILLWNPKIKNKNLIYAGDYLYIEDCEG